MTHRRETPSGVSAGPRALGGVGTAREGLRISATRIVPLAAAALFPAALAAQAAGDSSGEAPPLVGDRPDFTESAAVVTRLQLETGYTYEELGGTDLHTLGELLVRVPVSGRLELRVGVPSWARERSSGTAAGATGLTDASLGVKLGLRNPGSGGPAVAVLAGSTLPTGDEFGSDGLHPAARLAGALDLSERVSVAANAGAASAEDEGGRYAELSGSVSLGIGATDAVGVYLEAYGLAPTGGGPAAGWVLDGGATWLAGPHLQLDVRAGTGLAGPSPDLVLGAGAVWRP